MGEAIVKLESPASMLRPADLQAVSEAAALMQAITAAASNPAVDIDKLERLLAMHERIKDRQAKAAYATALAEMQEHLPVIVERGGIKDRSNNVQSTYALWEDLNQEIRPALANHGFSLSFRTGRDGDKITVTGVLMHRDGHSEETTLALPIDASGSKNAVQAVGSSTSYGKRYTACALLNITSRGEDDDGRAAGRAGFISEEQLGDLVAMLESVGADRAKFLAFMKVDSLKDIREKDYQKAVVAINAKRGRS